MTEANTSVMLSHSSSSSSVCHVFSTVTQMLIAQPSTCTFTWCFKILKKFFGRGPTNDFKKVIFDVF